MGQQIKTKYKMNDVVCWESKGKTWSGNITSTHIDIDKFGTQIKYTVFVSVDFLSYNFYDTIYEEWITGLKENKVEQSNNERGL